MNKASKLKVKRERWNLARLKTQTALAMVIGIGMGVAPAAWAQVAADTLPTGASIAHGQADISQTGTAMRIDQQTATLITDWDSFSIGSDASVTFVQPDAGSLAVNRVTTLRPSELLGQLKANGRIMLINPAGILVGKTGQIDVGALTATTLNASNGDILGGNGTIALSGNSSGAIRNYGRITVPDGGKIALIAPVIENRGSLSASGGAVLLAAGSEVDLDLGGQGLVSLRVNKGALDAAVTNGGIVRAGGGVVVMTAKGMDELSRAVVNNEGVVEARGLASSGGRILLGGGAGTEVRNSGLLDVSAEAGQGGAIRLEGETIALASNARLDATGASGGGTILVGGSWQNGDPSVYQARTVSIAAGSVLDASAIASGSGGTIVAWSDTKNSAGLTDVRGNLLARGGIAGGDGGQIETSGYHLKVDGIRVRTDATSGRTGQWLLDPYNITIGNGGDTVSGNYTASAPGSLIDVATLMTALSSSNVTVSTGLAGSAGAEAGTITVSSAISSNSAFNLELKAASSIAINADITRGGTGGVTLRAGTGQVSGTGTLVLGGGTKLSLAHGTTLANAINLTGNATIDIAPFEVEYLLVGGGASGAGSVWTNGFLGGSGGSGGQVLSGSLAVGSTATVAVGAGSAGSSGTAGGNSSLTAAGGAIVTASGGAGVSTTNAGGSGNGGANLASGRTGGSGVASTITGTTARFGGGGSAGGSSSSTGALAGTDGGGSGAAYAGGATPGSGGAGTANTGGGGGGAGGTSTSAGAGGAGGSGVVILRYAGADVTTGGTETSFTGNGTNGTNGVTYQVRTFASGGTLTVGSLSAALTGPIGGSGNLTLNASSGTLTLSGASTYTGETAISGGRVVTSSANALGASTVSLANVAGMELTLGSNLSVGALAGGGAAGGNVTMGAYALDLGLNNADASFAGTLAGSGALTKQGTGTLTLTGSLVNPGAVLVQNGTLALGGSSALGTNDGSGRFTYGGNITLNGTSTLAFGSSATQTLGGVISGDAAGLGVLQLTGAGTLKLTGDNAGFGGSVIATAGTLGVYRSTALGTGSLVLGGGAKLSLASGTTLANAIQLASGGATIEFAPLEVEYLVVGGGGGGGYARGGGGGGGGFLTGSTSLTGTAYTMVVGTGGTYLNQGANSSFSGTGISVTALGGGSGSGGNQAGGSGGGASAYGGGLAGSGTAGQGYGGGLGSGTDQAAGGGGGAGGAGGVGSGTTGGAGGAGRSSDITGSVQWYAGGGGGFSGQSGGAATLLGGAGGLGGGGKGGDLDSYGMSGTANTGGGAGGTYTSATGVGGGTGGSGVVVVRYAGTDATSGGTEASFTGNGTIGANGITYQVRTFTGSGTLVVDNLSAALTGTISGSGNLTINAASGAMTLSGANSYTGDTTISAGRIVTANTSALGSNSAVSLANVAGTELSATTSLTVGSLAGGGATGGNLVLASGATFSADSADTSTTFGGAISGAGSFIKTGTGTQTLTGSYGLDAINVSAGTLVLGGAIALGTDDGFGRKVYGGSITIGGNGTLSFGSSATQVLSGTLTGDANGSGLLRLTSGTLKLAGNGSTFTGAVSVTGGTLGLYRNNAMGSGLLSIGGASLKLGRAVTNFSNDIALTGATDLSFDTEVDYLVIGGGGSGGAGAGGGGGGGFVEGTMNLSAASTTVTVGAGGAASMTNGSSSAFGSVTALGGGGGATMGSYTPGLAGASGGGGNRAVVSGGVDTAGAPGGAATQPGSASGGYGFAGGAARGVDGTNTKGGGGGGAGGAGQNAPTGTTAGGAGGAGRYSAITGTSLAYAGGGGGGVGNAIAAGGAGGIGGGGSGAVSPTGVIAGTAGMANTGGGGGGGSSKSGAGSEGGAGGSGIVVVRYLGADASTGGTGTTGTGMAQGYTLHTFTNTGTSSLSLNAAATLGGRISGSGALTVNAGTNTISLTGANTFGGTTTVASGTLSVGNGEAGGTLGSGAVVNNATLTFNRNADLTVANAISGTGAVQQLGSGIVTLTGANSWSGVTTIANGAALAVGAGDTEGTPGTGAVTNNGTLIFNRSDALTVSNALSGSGRLRQTGSGALTLTGSNSFTGGTTLDGGTLVLGHASGLGSSGTIGFGGGTLKYATGITTDLSARFATSANQQFRIDTNGQAITLASALGGSGSTLTKLGAGALTLKGNNSYTGATTIAAGSLILEHDAPTGLSGTISGPGALTIRSVSTSFTQPMNLAGWSFGSDLAALTVGKSGNTAAITLGAASLAAPVTIHGGTIAFGGAFGTMGALVITASGAVTQSAALFADSLTLSGSGSYMLTHAGNAVTSLSGGASGARIGALSFANAGALSLTGAGIYSSGDVMISTGSGNLTLGQTVDTTANGTTALRLAAGTSAAAGGDGTPASGNVIVTGTPLLKVGSGGRIVVYSGDVAGSTGLTALAGGSGSGRFRYNSTLDSAGYTTALQANVVNAVYRQQPRIDSAVVDQTITYGDTPGTVALVDNSALLNGDTFAGTIPVAVQSSAGFIPAGTYAMHPTGKLAALGYDMSGVAAGTLTVGRKALTISGIAALGKTYDGGRLATVQTAGVVYGGLLAGDLVTVSATGLFADKNVGAGKVVTLTSSYSGADVGNYTITDQVSASATIIAKGLAVSGIAALGKTYDGTLVAGLDTSGAVYDGLVAGDFVTVSASGLFADKNVGAGKVVTLTSSYSGADVGNYTVTGQTTTLADISPKAMTISGIAAQGKVYDGTAQAALDLSGVTLNGLIAGDSISVTATGAFADKNVGVGKVVTLASSYSGADVGNYAVTGQASASATIIAKGLAVSGVAALGKTYDGTRVAGLDASGAVYDGLLAGDLVTLSASGLFADKNVGTGKAVALTSSYSGADVGNYAITDQASASATIIAKGLTVSGIAALGKTYDGTLMAGLDTSGAVYDGLVAGDLVTVSASGLFADKNVGAGKVVTLTSSYAGADVGNYIVTGQATTLADITSKALTISGIAAQGKVYDGTVQAVLDLSGVTLNGLIAGDSISVTATGAFADKNVGVGKMVTLTSSYSGADVGNYAVTDQASASATIIAKGLAVSGIAALGKTYDGTRVAGLDASGAVYDGLLAGDLVTVSATGLFADKNVGAGKVVTLTSSYSGADVGNYAITDQVSASATIIAKGLTVSGIAALGKTYDGTLVAGLDTSGAVYDGLVAGDFVTVSASGLFADKNVGAGKVVTLASSYSGADVGNYTVTGQATTLADITSKALTISGIAAQGKVYDGTAQAALDLSGVTLNGLIAGDSISVTANGAFADKNVGVGKVVTLASSYSGADVGNYAVTGQATTAADITPKALTISGIAAQGKVYDGTAQAALDLSGVTLNGLIAGDSVSVSATGAFADKNVGVGKVVTLASSYSGADVGNYAVTGQATTLADITPSVSGGLGTVVQEVAEVLRQIEVIVFAEQPGSGFAIDQPNKLILDHVTELEVDAESSSNTDWEAEE